MNQNLEKRVELEDPFVANANYITMTTVQEMINKVALPVLDTVPTLKKQIDEFTKEQETLKDMFKQTQYEVN